MTISNAGKRTIIGGKASATSCIKCKSSYALDTTLEWRWEDDDPERAVRSLKADLCKPCRESLRARVNAAIEAWADSNGR